MLRVVKHSVTIDFVLSLGMRDVVAVCTGCGEQFSVPVSAIDLPGHTPLELVSSLRPIACDECSAPAEVDVRAMGFEPP